MIPENTNSFLWKLAEYGFYLFFALFPFVIYQSYLYGGTSSRSVNLTLFASALAIFLGVWLLKNKNDLILVKSPVVFLGLLYVLVLTLSSVLGHSFSVSFWSVATRTTGLWYFANLIIFFLFLTAVFSERRKHDKLVLTIIVSSAIYSVLAFFGPEGLGILFKGYLNDGFTFGNTTFAGMYLFGAFLLSVYYLLQKEIRRWWMYLLPFLIVLNPNFLNIKILLGDFVNGFWGEARASTAVLLISIFGLLVVWLISKIKSDGLKKKISYGAFALGLILAIAASVSLLSADGFMRKVYLKEASGARPLVWEISSKVISEKPILGWGPDNFERVFEANYDNRLLQDKYGNEAWFDRAHNVLVDQSVDTGRLGLLSYVAVYIAIILSLIYCALNSKVREDRLLASILVVYFPLHFVELQTAFDTAISYPLLAFMTASAVILYHRAKFNEKEEEGVYHVPQSLKVSMAVAILGFFSWSVFVGLFPFVEAQIANGYIRKVGSAEKRITAYPNLFGSPVDEHSFLWRTSTDFQRGIGQNPKVLQDQNKVAELKRELAYIEDEYRQYVLENPTHFRARLNFADILIYQRLFEVDKLQEAQEVLDEAIKLVPQSPQPYWMKAVAYVYMGKFDQAREYAQKGLALNPDVVQSQKIVKYVENSAKTFPELDLYFFLQI